jgi:hypothetical protein
MLLLIYLELLSKSIANFSKIIHFYLFIFIIQCCCFVCFNSSNFIITFFVFIRSILILLTTAFVFPLLLKHAKKIRQCSIF